MTETERESIPLRHRAISPLLRCLNIAVLAPALMTLPPLAIAGLAQPTPTQISQRAALWDGELRMARLINPDQDVTALIVQLKILNKPETTYANAIYQVYAQINGQWVAVYTNAGARLVNARAGQMTLPPEVILMSDMQRLMDQGIDWSQVELRTVVTVRYDLQDGQSNQQVEWEDTQRFDAIAVTTTPNLISSSFREMPH